MSDLLSTVLAGIPNPGQGAAPPGSAQIQTILGWVAWCVTAACVAGILIVAMRMVISLRRNEFSEHAMQLGAVMAGCIIAGSASGIVGALWT